MRLLRHGIAWLILVKHHDASVGSAQDKPSMETWRSTAKHGLANDHRITLLLKDIVDS
jgi:hypothetical protein